MMTLLTNEIRNIYLSSMHKSTKKNIVEKLNINNSKTEIIIGKDKKFLLY